MAMMRRQLLQTIGLLGMSLAAGVQATEGSSMRLKKATAVLVVDELEPCVEFWTKRLGFEMTSSVPEGDRLGFAILTRDGVELMYQSVASVAQDVPAILDGGAAARRSVLFIEVDDIEGIARALEGVAHLVPRRKTFYGADEIIVTDPAGNVLTFAQFGT